MRLLGFVLAAGSAACTGTDVTNGNGTGTHSGTDATSMGADSAIDLSSDGGPVADIETEPDCLAEIGPDEDPTLTTVNRAESSRVRVVVDLWGAAAVPQMLQLFDGSDRFDGTDSPLAVVHGTDDRIVLFSEAELLRDTYVRTGAPHTFEPRLDRRRDRSVRAANRGSGGRVADDGAVLRFG